MLIHNVPQGSTAWHALRAGMPTSSEFGKIITSKGERSGSFEAYALKLAVEKYLGKPSADGFQGNRTTARGHEQEPQARAEYMMMTGASIREVGLITDDLGRWGTSTDGLVGDKGVFEAKSKSDDLIFEQRLAWNEYGKHCPREHFAQVQGELMIAERDWCDLVFFNPEFPLMVVRVEADPVFHAKLESLLDDLIFHRDRLLSRSGLEPKK